MQEYSKTRENRVRRWAKRLGYVLQKSRSKHPSDYDMGGYQLTNPNKTRIVVGTHFDWGLEDIEEFLREEEKKLKELKPIPPKMKYDIIEKLEEILKRTKEIQSTDTDRISPDAIKDLEDTIKKFKKITVMTPETKKDLVTELDQIIKRFKNS